MSIKHKAVYWTSTALLAFGMLAGGTAQLFRARPNVEGMLRLGYPLYFMTIVAVWKILGTVAILVPRFPLLKEWAYAGLFFAMSGAVVSHVVSGDGLLQYVAPILFAVLVVVSWYFRPASRRLVPAGGSTFTAG